MATEKQTEANRQNAQKSTGPCSAEGKAHARFNAMKTGIDAESIVLPGEDPAAAETVRTEYYDQHQPQTPDERDTLDCIVHAVVLTRRLRKLEAQFTKHEMDSTPNLDPASPLGHVFSNASHKFIYLQSRMNSVERSFHRNLDRLAKLKAQRPPLDEVGANPQPPSPTPDPEPAPQPAETTAQTPELGSFPKTYDPHYRIPHWAHPELPEDCPHCRVIGFISEKCPYIRKTPGHPARLKDCPNCSILGHISPNCHYQEKHS